jgi:hypothetical protein
LIYNYLELIEGLNKQHWDIITKIRKVTQEEENRRKINNDLRSDERINLINELEDNFPKEQIELEIKIKELLLLEQSDELDLQFSKLKDFCEGILFKKNNVINEFLKEINFRDQLYVDSMKNFRSNIETVIKLMRKQFIELRNEMFNHLDINSLRFL